MILPQYPLQPDSHRLEKRSSKLKTHTLKPTIASNKSDIAANAISATESNEENHLANDDSSSSSASTGSSSNRKRSSKLKTHILKAMIAPNTSHIAANPKLAKKSTENDEGESFGKR